MSSRIAFITRKRSALKQQITSFCNTLDQGKIDNASAKLRLKHVTELFYAYEDLHDELALLDERNEGLEQMEEIRDNFYDLASRVEDMPSAGVSRYSDAAVNIPLGTSTLPKFDGDHNKWLSFKNIFLSMVDAHTDLSDVSKFLYLKTSVTGAAAIKLARFDATAENYRNAWNSLVDSYEKKRILVLKHYDAILDIPRLTTATPEGLSKIVDEVRQHLNMLESLQAKPDEGFIVRHLERALPFDVRQKWEESLSLDVLPDFNQFYTFINDTALRLRMLEHDTARHRDRSRGKRRFDREPQSSKSRRNNSGVKTFVTAASSVCPHCCRSHPIYRCPEFEGLNAKQRWEIVKAKKLCRNCLRVHPGACNSSHCKRCGRFHHTLLHINALNQAASRPVVTLNKSSAELPEAKGSQ